MGEADPCQAMRTAVETPTMTDDVRPKNITLTPELLERLRTEGVNVSALVETLLRQHFGMPPRPEVETRGRWKPGETAKKTKT